MAQPAYELISFRTCPYVQRSRITLLHKDVEHKVTHIDLADPPQWFKDISPLGKVPVLRITDGDRTTNLFESAVINEYLDRVTEGDLLPDDPLAAAVDKAWIEFASELNGYGWQLISARDEDAYQAAFDAIAGLLQRVEAELGDGPYWHGDTLSLVDTSFAPALQRLAHFEPVMGLLATVPRVRAWTEALLATPAVQQSGPEDVGEALEAEVRRLDGALATKLVTA